MRLLACLNDGIYQIMLIMVTAHLLIVAEVGRMVGGSGRDDSCGGGPWANSDIYERDNSVKTPV